MKLAVLFLVTSLVARAVEPLQLSWPTPNTAWVDGKPLEAYIQHAGSGDPESGTFGGVRSGGHQFHEGIDIKCVSRDRRGEPIDDVFAAMDGVVRHVNGHAGDSNYGRYIVLEHPEQSPGVYTLYAHLSRIAPGLRAGDHVRRGQVIATMGHSSDRPIPRDRAHLHFEIGVMVTQNFNVWYARKGFGSPNEQGLWNGMNLMGIDPLFVFNGWRAGRFKTMQDIFTALTPAARVRIASHLVPDFVQRYPSLVMVPIPLGGPAAWEIQFNWTGVPFAWRPLTAAEAVGLAANNPIVIDANGDIERHERSKSLVVRRGSGWIVSRDLETVLQQLFGIR